MLVPLLLTSLGGVFRFVSLKKSGALFDEQITRAVVDNIRRGDFRNDWFYVPNIPAGFRIHCYNFSSYFYADALALGPHPKQALFRERFFSALCGSLAVGVFYFVFLRIFGSKEAVAGTAIVALSPLLVQDAHYARPEAFVTLLCAVVYACCCGLLYGRRPNAALALGALVCGLLIASKISFVPLALVLLVCACARGVPLRRAGTVCAVCCVLGAFAGVPDAFFHPTQFLEGVQMLRNQYANEHVPHSLPDSQHCWAMLGPYFWQTAGAVLCVLVFVGSFHLGRQRRYTELFIVGGPVAFYALFFGQQRVFFERNLSHIVPLGAGLAAVGLVATANLLPRIACGMSPSRSFF